MQNQTNTETLYHPNGQISFERIVNENGAWEEITYDEIGNRLTFENSYGFSSEATYDKMGNTLTRKDSNGNNEEWTYDEKGNALSHKRFF